MLQFCFVEPTIDLIDWNTLFLIAVCYYQWYSILLSSIGLFTSYLYWKSYLQTGKSLKNAILVVQNSATFSAISHLEQLWTNHRKHAEHMMPTYLLRWHIVGGRGEKQKPKPWFHQQTVPSKPISFCIRTVTTWQKKLKISWHGYIYAMFVEYTQFAKKENSILLKKT